MIAIVTGGSSGIGRAICKTLADREFEVVNISRREVPKEGGVPIGLLPNITTELCDVTHTKSLKEIIKKYQVDVLVNNVGILLLTDFLKEDETSYAKIMDTNFRSTVFATQTALEIMIKRKTGVIINIASTSGYHASPDTPIYGASKAALINFTYSIAAEYGQYGIRCNCVCPGSIHTALVDTEEPLPQEELRKIPIGREGTPEDIANVVSKIIDCDYLNGACILVDGGKSHGVWRWGQ